MSLCEVTLPPFVCSFDYFGGGLAVYRRKTVLEGRKDIPYEDGSHVYVLNSEYQEGNAAPAILEYLRCIRENDVDYGYESELMRAVCPAIKSIRSDERKEASYMTMQMLMADERRAGRNEGIQIGENRIVARMFCKGKSVEDIAEDTDTPIEDVREMLQAEGLLK